MTKPLAKEPSMNMNTHGIQAKIIFCVGSVGARFSFCCIHIEIPNRIGRTPRLKIAKMLPTSGTPHGSRPKRFRIDDGSGALRSVIHAIQLAWRNSIVTKITLYSEKKIGICRKIGRHPDAGFTLLSLYSFIMPCCMACLSSPVRSLSFSISG